MDKDYCLLGVKKATKLTKDDIIKEFGTVVRERKRDEEGIFSRMYGPEIKEKTSNNEVSLKSSFA